MAVTRNNISIPQATWTNLYSAASITVGTQVQIINKGVSACYVAVSVAAPVSTTVGVPCQSLQTLYVSAGEVGLWAYVPQGTTTLLVQD